MRSLYLRIYLTVLVALALFALASGWLVQRHMVQERALYVAAVQERAAAWGELLQRSLPGAEADDAEQAAALQDWSQRLRLPLALDGADGRRIAASALYLQREAAAPPGLRRGQAIRLDDGRTLWIMRPPPLRGPGPGAGQAAPRAGSDRPMQPGMHPGPGGATPWWPGVGLPGGLGLAVLLLVLFLAVAAGAFPVVRRLTRRLESLKQGVEAFGAGALDRRVAEDGRDEVAALGASFNQAAARIEALLHAHQSLLANASHELRSPLARLTMAVSMLEDAPAAQRVSLQHEIHANIAELDALVEEVLLASRLDSSQTPTLREPVELLALAAEEGARVQATLDGQPLSVPGDERLLRRALRNMLENARRYGAGDIDIGLRQGTSGRVELSVCDRGPGVPEAYRERVFEAFFRMPGHAEREGGVGLGLSLVRQIAQRHGGTVSCLPREGGGSCFVLALPGA